jgi:uncharacterized repeat protein (TIGR02543 family)
MLNGGTQVARIDDLVGTKNSSDDILFNVWGSAYARRITRSVATRRVWEGNAPRNIRNNEFDFHEIRYSTANRGEIEYYRPINGARPTYSGNRQVNVVANIAGVSDLRVFPANGAGTGQTVGFTAGVAPVGYVFTGWTANQGIEIIDADSPINAHFVMQSATGGAITVTANYELLPMPPSSIIINQVYGTGGPQLQNAALPPSSTNRPTATNAVSHGFIELYNPTGRTINIGGMSLQIRTDNENLPLRPEDEGLHRGWYRINLPSHFMEPGSSFLVVSTDWYNINGQVYIEGQANPIPHATGFTPRYTITDADLEWDRRFSNNSMTVALVNGSGRLTEGRASGNLVLSDWSRIIDLVGAGDGDASVLTFLGEREARRISRQRSVRRIAYSNRRNNRTDFTEVRYEGISNAELELVRPRNSNDTRENGTITVVGASPDGGGASHQTASPGERVVISAGWHPNLMFSHWTVREPA